MKTIVVKPLLNEKTLNLAQNLNQFTFEVGLDANKTNIAQTIAKKFNVEVEKVRIINKVGQTLTFGRKRTPGRKSNVKKAIVTLKKGQKIDLFEVK